MNKLILSLLVVIVSGCALNYRVNSNLDKDNFKDYFSPAAVKIYSSEADINGKFRFIGLVEGEDCQQKTHHQQPDEITARTNARKKAYQLHANGIIFTGCALINNDQASKQCLTTKVCYGKAYQIEQSNE